MPSKYTCHAILMIYMVIEKQDLSCYACADKLFNRLCLFNFHESCIKQEQEKIPKLSKRKGYLS